MGTKKKRKIDKTDLANQISKKKYPKAIPTYPFLYNYTNNLKIKDMIDGIVLVAKNENGSTFFNFPSPTGQAARIPLNEKEVDLIKNVFDINSTMPELKAFLTAKCNVQNVADLSWDDILGHLRFWLITEKQKQLSKKTSGKAGDKKNQKHKKTLVGEWSNPMTKLAMMSRVGIDSNFGVLA